MILDRFNEFSDAQAETTVAAHPSDSVVDLLAAGDAESRRMRFHCVTNETLTSSGSATVQIKLETDSDEAFGSAATLYDTGALDFDVATGVFTAGGKVTGKGGLILPSNCERYLRVTYTIAVAVLTAGKFDAFLSNDADTNEF